MPEVYKNNGSNTGVPSEILREPGVDTEIIPVRIEEYASETTFMESNLMLG